MKSINQSDVGLPSEPLLNRRLAFDETSEMLVLSGTPRRKDGFAQLYLKKLSSSQYESAMAYARGHFVSLGGDLFVCAWALGCDSRLHFLVGEVVLETGVRANPVHDHGLVTLDLRTKESMFWRIYEQEPLWIVSDILGTSRDGSQLRAIVGFRSETGTGPVHYHLCDIDLASRGIEKLGIMATPFF